MIEYRYIVLIDNEGEPTELRLHTENGHGGMIVLTPAQMVALMADLAVSVRKYVQRGP